MYGALVVCVWTAGIGAVVASVSEVALLKVRLHINDTPVDTLDIQEDEEKMVIFYLDDFPLQAAGDIFIKVRRICVYDVLVV
ncbi:hypothetical protein E2C01_038048 [Portunus trituberculatus]|uniref:Uncharacterized protein n=1 Tax=Portunus trituberculatus TaxID=210409 RepID=A0A5B7FFR3_PORTR|nr:hypothetical protein [Portunus trituberculatus]